MEMATVNLKDGTSKQIPLDDVEDYMLNNSEELEYKTVKVRRPMRSEKLKKTVKN